MASLLAVQLDPLASEVPAWLLLYLASLAGLGAATVKLASSAPGSRAPGLLVILVWAFAIRAPLLATEPSLSNDIYRYVWEGRLVAEGLDPWDQSPEDPSLAALAAEAPEWSSMNHRNLPALYPAGAQWIFGGLSAVRADPFLFRCAFLAADLALILLLGLLLLRLRRRLEWLLLYAWHPLAAAEAVSSGHYDPIALLAMVGGLLLWSSGRQVRAFAVWGAAIALKFVGGFPAIFALGLLLRRREWRRTLVGTLVLSLPIVLLSIPFAVDGSLPIGSLGEYGRHWSHHASVHALLSLVVGLHPARGVLLLVGAGWLGFLLWRGAGPLAGYAALFVGMLILSPVVHPWYGLWLLVVLPFFPREDLYLLTGLLPLSYLSWTVEAAGGPWRAPTWVAWLGYGLPVAVSLWLLWRSRGRTLPSSSASFLTR